MYHIADDPRSRRSAGLICGALLQCLGGKELAEITVTDLWKASGVSRATFYRLFDNVSDVLTYQCEQVMGSILLTFRQSPPEKRTYREMSLTILRTAMEHADLLDAVSKAGRTDILYHALRKNGSFLRTLYFVDELPRKGDPEYFLNCVCLLISALIDHWIRGGRQQSAEELYDSFTDTLSMLREAFCG